MSDKSDDTVTVSLKIYNDLLLDSIKLGLLEAGGVDNWDWYGDSLYPEGEKSIEDWKEEINSNPISVKED